VASKTIDRLLFMQAGKCFFCQQKLERSDATIEHLVAKSRGGGNDLENIVACCRVTNSWFGSISVKEKMRILLLHKGEFACPHEAEQEEFSATTESECDEEDALYERLVVQLGKMMAKPGSVHALLNTISNSIKNKAVANAGALSKVFLNRLHTDGWFSVCREKIIWRLAS